MRDAAKIGQVDVGSPGARVGRRIPGIETDGSFECLECSPRVVAAILLEVTPALEVRFFGGGVGLLRAFQTV